MGREFIQESDGTWFGRVLEKPGCMTVGDTMPECEEMLDDAERCWDAAQGEDDEPTHAR